MACECKSDINIPEQAKIYLSSTINYLSEKINNIVKASYPGQVKENNGHLELLTDNFAGFVKALAGQSFTEAEQENINILALDINEMINFGAFSRTRTLKSWTEIFASSGIIKIINENKLTVFFQPIIDLKKKEIFGYECLTRGFDESGKFIPPIEIFDFARRNDMMFKLDNQTRKNAIRSSFAKNIKTKIFINFIPTSIYDPANCLKETIKVIDELGIKPQQIIFEVVESEKVANLEHLKKVMDFYRKEGFLTALDDLASGYSSLNMFVYLNPDFIKIDQNIIRDIDKDKLKQSVFEALLKIAENSGTKVLAEGIETKAELDFVSTYNIDLAQGYYFSRPAAEPVFELAL